jgi:dTDP-4-amino-4,6-dideoxygalactose transaminase
VIPFNKPVYLGTELAAIAVALQQNGHAAGGGPFGKQCEQRLSAMLAGQPTLMMSSCTHALEVAAHLLDVGPGDEVILPSFTFVSTANAFVLRGARPVFADVDASGNLDPAEVDRLRTARTKAICVVHYGGNSCDLNALMDAAEGVPVIEDAAQALGATFDGWPLGTFGAASAFSFHETKNIGCGEGGALSLSDGALLERAEYFRDKGTNRRRFLDGLVDKYTWVDVGSSPLMSDVSAAYLSAQLEGLDRVQARRRVIWERYDRELSAAIERAGAYVIRPRAENGPNHNVFALVFARPEQRAPFIAHMKSHGITAPFHYVALHRSPKGEVLHDGRALPVTDRLSSCLVRLPLYFNLTDDEQGQVIEQALAFLRTR